MNVFALTASLAIGGLLAVQASVNLQISKAVGTPYGASAIQLAVAALFLTGLTAATGQLGALAELAHVEPWKLLGGIASPVYITSAILLLPRLGALASVGLFVTGQVLVSLALDFGGLIGVSPRPFGVGRVLGAVAVVAGIALVIRGQRWQRPPVGWYAVGLVAGGVLPVQGAVNAALKAELHQPFAVGMTSFLVATVTILLVLGFMLIRGKTPRPQLGPLRTMPWWGWLGGIAASAYVTATFLLIPVIGAATTVALTVTGQQVVSALIDHHGYFRLPKRPLTALRLGGLALLAAGSAIVQLGI